MGAARGLLARAQAVLDPDERLWVVLAPEVAETLAEGGEHDRAEALLTEALRRGGQQDERGPEAHALVQRAYMRIFSRPEGASDEALQVADQAMPVFEQLKDMRGVAKTARSWWA